MPPSSSRPPDPRVDRPRASEASKAIVAGLAASLVSIGLARFGYTPLLPAMIHDHWFPPAAVATLGAANLAGYLIGALSGRALARHASPVTVMRWMMLLASVAFLACAFPLSQAWFFVWRLASGVAGGAIMVLVSGVVLHHVAPSRRGAASGAIFLGIGLGVVISGTVVPFMLTVSLRATWLVMGAVALALTAAAWTLWPRPIKEDQPEALASLNRAPMSRELKLLLAQYALMAAGLVPVMLFLVDYVSRGLALGTGLGAAAWVAYGVGSMGGPIAYGIAADRLGARAAARWVLAVQAVTIVALAEMHHPAALLVLSALAGSFPSGIVPLVLARVHELVDAPHARQAAWSQATVAFALTQAGSGYAYSAIYSATGGHHAALFVIAAVCIGLSLVLVLTGERTKGVSASRRVS